MPSLTPPAIGAPSLRSPLTRHPLGRWYWVVALALGLLAPDVGLSRSPEDLPTPPSGFEWQRLDEIKGAILKPAGWTFAKTQEERGWEFSETGPRGGGTFTLSVVKGPSAQKDAKKLADDFLKGMSIEFIAEKTWGSDEGPFVLRAGFFADRETPATRKAFIQILVNPKTGTLVTIGFEASAHDWSAAWKVGQVICKVMLLDDDV